jgi:hypothetical protein
MNFGPEADLHNAMNRHRRAGVTPGLFDMDGLRIDEMIYANQTKGHMFGGLLRRAAHLRPIIVARIGAWLSVMTRADRAGTRHPL